jgi:hypothetical protein
MKTRSELTSAAKRDSGRSPKLELLLQCSCADAANLALHTVRVPKDLSWDAVVDAAEYHGLAPILHNTLVRPCAEPVPEYVASRLRDCYRESAKRNFILTTQLLDLLRAFATEGIAVVPVKGPALAESLYRDPALRPFSDLDILVRPRDVPAALRLLSREGYSLASHMARVPTPTLLNLNFELLLHRKQRAPVDLQWKVGLADYPFCIDPEMLWRSLTRCQIAGSEAASLSAEALMLFLCVHGAKHAWSRLQWLGDVARLVRAQPDWESTMKFAAEAGCRRPLLLALLLAHELLEAPVPQEILICARGIDAVQRLACEVVAHLNCFPPREPESMELTRFNSRMAEQAWQKARIYAALLKAPTDKELEILLLPEKLFFLYYPLRGVRLALKYSLRLVRRWHRTKVRS